VLENNYETYPKAIADIEFLREEGHLLHALAHQRGLGAVRGANPLADTW
jgi:hypothetical protein